MTQRTEKLKVAKLPATKKDRKPLDPPDSGDEESDGERDLFTMSYLNREIPSSDEKSDDGHEKPKTKKRPSGPGDDHGPDDDDDDNNDPKPDGKGRKIALKFSIKSGEKATCRAITRSVDLTENIDGAEETSHDGSKIDEGEVASRYDEPKEFQAIDDPETFENGDKDGNPCRYVTYSHRYFNEDSNGDSSGKIFTQRDEVPAENVNTDIKRKYDKNGQPFRVVLPKHPEIPTSTKKIHEGVKWELGTDGIYRRGDLKWRPNMLLRQFRQDTGQYWGRSNVSGLLDAVITNNFSSTSVKNYNRRVRQYVNRNDSEVMNSMARQPRWTPEEVSKAVSVLNNLVRDHGLVYLIENWRKSILEEVRKQLDEYLGEGARGYDSVRTKFEGARAVGLTRKLKKLEEEKDKLKASELRPQNFFSVEDFKSDKEIKKAQAEKVIHSTKRTASGKLKKTTVMKATETKDAEDEAEASGSGSDEAARDERDSSDMGAADQPAKKRRKL